MKLSDYAKKVGVSYKTAHRWWQAGQLDAYQMESGTIIINKPTQQASPEIALYARVSSADQKADLERQIQRLQDYAAAKGYQVRYQVTEIGSGLNDNRAKLMKLLTNPQIGIVVVEHKDRLTRFGFNYIARMMEVQGRRIEVILPGDTENELVDDFVAVITSMCARIYGRRNAKRRAEKIKTCIEESEKSN